MFQADREFIRMHPVNENIGNEINIGSLLRESTWMLRPARK